LVLLLLLLLLRVICIAGLLQDWAACCEVVNMHQTLSCCSCYCSWLLL
jgi:hypothetical protein